MGLFSFSDRPGPGIPPDAPRKKGIARLLELLDRDFRSFWCSGMLAMISAIPYGLGLWFSVASKSLIPLILTGLLGGALAGPQLCCLYDTILRSLRDEPGFWWHRYRRAWRQNVGTALPLGAAAGLLLAVLVFFFCCMEWTRQLHMSIILVVNVMLLAGLVPCLFAQIALLDVSVLGAMRNALMLYFAFLPAFLKSALAQAVYIALMVLFMPHSAIVLLITSFWLPSVLSLMAIYPSLDESLQIEDRINAKREDEKTAR